MVNRAFRKALFRHINSQYLLAKENEAEDVDRGHG